jgi:pilus assembly protein CpaD
MHRLRCALLALPLATALAGCSTGAAGPAGTNRTLDSVHQPVVERTTYTLDLIGGVAGLPAAERQRLDAWLAALGAGTGDMLAVDGAAGPAALADLAAVTGRYGLLAGRGDAAATGLTPPGMLRVAVTRSSAHVPGCPDWVDPSAGQLDNRTSSNYGCGVNSNMAAMIADPQDLLRGRRDTGRTQVMTSDRAIQTWRAREAGVAKELPRSATLNRGGDQ